MDSLRILLGVIIIISTPSYASTFTWYHENPDTVDSFTVYCGSIPFVSSENRVFTVEDAAGLWVEIPEADRGKIFTGTFDNSFPWCWLTATNSAGEGGPSEPKPFPTLRHDSTGDGCVGLPDFNEFRAEYGLCEPI
jgi:hypothetical protein